MRLDTLWTDARPGITILPMPIQTQDRRQRDEDSITWTVNMGTAVGDLANGTRNAFSRYQVTRSIAGAAASVYDHWWSNTC